MESFRLLMLSAMYENGGNTTHRLLDGHPSLRVYPFESQLGTRLVQDHLTSLFPVKYRWPVFALDQSPSDWYEAIIDEECKVRIKTPSVSKFRQWPLDLGDGDRKACFLRRLDARVRSRGAPISTGGIVASFFEATFEAWKDGPGVADEAIYVGYSPIVVVDADRILGALPASQIVHVVRNPWSAYADTKQRAVPLSLDQYMCAWLVTQQHALRAKATHPCRVHVLRYEDLVAAPLTALGAVCERLEIDACASLATPSFCGVPLVEVYPWGTIRAPSPEANRQAAAELSSDETGRIESWAAPLLDAFGYVTPR